jgi:hypothetical protein
MDLQKYLEEHHPDEPIATPDGLDDAFIGVARQAGGLTVAVYDREKCVEILARDMSVEDAEEYFAFNTECAYVGINTPMFLSRPEPEEHDVV